MDDTQSLTASEFTKGLHFIKMSEQAFADLLEVSPDQVKQWTQGSAPIPRYVQLVFGSLIDAAQRHLAYAIAKEQQSEDLPPFLLADVGDREFIVHTHEPVFIGELLEDADLETAAAEISFHIGWGYNLTNLVWLSPVPDTERLATVMEAAADFLDEMVEE